MGRKRGSLVRRREGSPYWWTEFTVRGKRVRKSTERHEKDEAELIALDMKKGMLGTLKQKPFGNKLDMRLDEACANYWDGHGKRLATARDIKRMSRMLIKGFGAETLLSAITTDDVANYMTRRLSGELTPDPSNGDPRTMKACEGRKDGPLANATVDNERILLRAIIKRADEISEAAVPNIRWNRLTVPRAEKQRLLTYTDQNKLFAALGDDLRDVVEFDITSGLRVGNVMKLKWEEVDFDGEYLALRTKSKKPNGAIHYVPITARMKAILLRHRGRHPVYVFTYVSRQTKCISGKWWHRGERYPFAENGWRTQWYNALRTAGLWNGKASLNNFRFHDLRHTAASRALDATDNLYLVKELLGHAEIRTTERYAKLAQRKLRFGMEATDRKSQKLSHWPNCVGKNQKTRRK
jgi:integrase